MISHLHKNFKSFPELLESPRSLLIRLGDEDEALCYQARILSQLDAYSLAVYFHDTSLILERVRLFGSVLVEVDMADGAKFSGELKSCPQQHSLILELGDKILTKSDVHERIVPVT